MRTTSMLLFAAVMAMVTTPAGAELYTWNTTGSLNPGSGASCAGGVACKATFTSTIGGQSLVARAYSTPVYDPTSPFNISGNWVEARIATYGGGIGIANNNSSDTASEGSAPEHAIDNNGVKDLLVFELPAGAWDPESFTLGWLDTDSDVQAFIGGASLGAGYDFRNVCFSGCTGSVQTLTSLGFSEIGSGDGFVNVPVNTATSFNTTSTGRYLIMSGNLGQTSITADNDFFKLSQLVANRTGNTVPITGTILLMMLGLTALVGVRSRRFSRLLPALR